MIYLSQLVLDPRSRQVRSELGDPYQMHRTISKAFGDGPRAFDAARPLFRVDERRDGSLQLLVQSLARPDWSRVEERQTYLTEPPKLKELKEPDALFRVGRRLRFRLRANPTVRRIFERASRSESKQTGKRIGVYKEEAQRKWLEAKAEKAGFRVLDCRVADRGFLVSRKPGGEQPIRHLCVDFEGILQVADPDRFLAALESGIGSAKGFGFGLLSVAPA
jgi:CRISPR system Cascade subunit CasE